MRMACLAVTLFLFGCAGSSVPEYQRFIPIGGRGESPLDTKSQAPIPRFAALALDTKTGELCLTYRYRIDVDYPEWKNLPSCKSLFEGKPDYPK